MGKDRPRRSRSLPEKKPSIERFLARWPRRMLPSMTDLTLQPTVDRTQFEVVADGRVVGRVTLFKSGRNRSQPWLWSIGLAFREGHDPTYGYEATLELARRAFAKSWN